MRQNKSLSTEINFPVSTNTTNNYSTEITKKKKKMEWYTVGKDWFNYYCHVNYVSSL